MATPPTSLDEQLFDGPDDVLLPASGVWFRLRLPTPEQLIRRGLFPKRLLTAAIAAGPNASRARVAEQAARMSDEDGQALIEENEQFRAELVRLMVRARRATREDPWQPFALTLEQIHQLKSADYEALAGIAERTTTPARVTAYALMQRGEISPEQAIAMRDADSEVVDIWESFRDWSGGGFAGPERTNLGEPTQLPRRDRRSRRRASA